MLKITRWIRDYHSALTSFDMGFAEPVLVIKEWGIDLAFSAAELACDLFKFQFRFRLSPIVETNKADAQRYVYFISVDNR